MRVRDGLASELVNNQGRCNQGRRKRVLCQHKTWESCDSNTWELRSFDHTSCYVLIDAFMHTISYLARSKADSTSSGVFRC